MRKSVRNAVRFAGILGLLVLLLESARAEDWPQFGGPRNDNISPSTGLISELPPLGPKVVWEVKGMGGGFASPAVAQGRVFVVGRQYWGPSMMWAGTKQPKVPSPDVLYCLDAKDGKVLWTSEFKFRFPCKADWVESSTFTPTVDGDRVYQRGPDGEMRCLAVADGKTLWSWPKDQPEYNDPKKPVHGYNVAGRMALCDGLLIFDAWSGGNARLIALDAKTQQEVWHADRGCWGYNGGNLAIMDAGGKKILPISNRVYDPKTGKELCKPWGGFMQWVPGFSGNRVIVDASKEVKVPKEEQKAAQKQYGGAWNREYGLACYEFQPRDDGQVDVKPVWEWTERDDKCRKVYAGAMIVGGYAYMFLTENAGTRLVCLDMTNGKKAWQLDIKDPKGGLGFSNSLYADGKIIYIFKGLMTMIPVSPKGPGEPSTVRVSDESFAAPALVDGLLYLRDDEGTVKCLDLRAKENVPALVKAAPPAGDWPEMAGPAGNYTSPQKGLISQFTELPPKEVVPTGAKGKPAPKPANAKPALKEYAVKVAWESRADAGASTPIVVDGRIYLMGRKNFFARVGADGQVAKGRDGKIAYQLSADTGEGPYLVSCLDLAGGKPAWRHAFSTDKLAMRLDWPWLCPAVDQGRVYAIDPARELVCLAAADGKPLWKQPPVGTADGRPIWRQPSSGVAIGYRMDGPYAADQPVVVGADLYCPGLFRNRYDLSNAQLTCFDAAGGSLRWTKYLSVTPNTPFGPAVLVQVPGGGCLVRVLCDALYGFDAAGMPLWQYQPDDTKDKGRYDPLSLVVCGKRLYINRQKSTDALELQPAGGKVVAKRLWTSDAPLGRCCGVTGTTYFAIGANAGLFAYDAATGKPRWSGPADKSLQFTHGLLADGKVILLTNRNDLVLVKADGSQFELLSKAPIPGVEPIWSPPALAGGCLLVRDCSGKLFSIDLRAQ